MTGHRSHAVIIALLLAAAASGQGPYMAKSYTRNEYANFSYAIISDNQSITIALKVDDPTEALKLARNGMEIWLDPRGKKSKKIGIHYPLGTPPNDRRIGPDGREGNAGDTGNVWLRKQAILTLLQKKEVNYTGFTPATNRVKDVSDTTGITIATSYPAHDALYYSVRIPLIALPEPLDPHHPLSVGIIIKGMTLTGGPDGGPGGDEGGGPPPGVAGPGDDDFRRLLGDDTVWQKVVPTW